LKNNDNLTKKQKKIKEDLSLAKLNLKSIRALHIRKSFQQIYQADNLIDFEILLNKWYFWATHSQLPPIIKAAKTIKAHWEGILKWKESQINNGITGKLDFSKVNENCLPT